MTPYPTLPPQVYPYPSPSFTPYQVYPFPSLVYATPHARRDLGSGIPYYLKTVPGTLPPPIPPPRTITFPQLCCQAVVTAHNVLHKVKVSKSDTASTKPIQQCMVLNMCLPKLEVFRFGRVVQISADISSFTLPPTHTLNKR